MENAQVTDMGRIGPVLQVSNLTKRFTYKERPDFIAVDNVSFCIEPGEIVGLVGGSGSGKTTVARLVTRLLDPTSGAIMLAGRDVSSLHGKALRSLGQDVQMVFQEPAPSFDPRRTLLDGICESTLNAGASKQEACARAYELMQLCGLSKDIAHRRPREVSGGQCQRAAIARALAPNPPLVICDEATSSLDVTVQAQIVDLLTQIRRERATAFLFICHDLALVQDFCDRVLVMERGRIVEEGDVSEVLLHPTHPYTQALLRATLSV